MNPADLPIQARIWCDGGCRGNPGLGAGAAVARTADDEQAILGRRSIFLPKNANEAPESVRATYRLNTQTNELEMTNNIAEFYGYVQALELAKELNLRRIEIVSDSKMVTALIAGTNTTKLPHLSRMLLKVKDLISQFDHVQVKHTERENNTEADTLGNQTMDQQRNIHAIYPVPEHLLHSDVEEIPSNLGEDVIEEAELPEGVTRGVPHRRNDDLLLIQAALVRAIDTPGALYEDVLRTDPAMKHAAGADQDPFYDPADLRERYRDLLRRFEQQNGLKPFNLGRVSANTR